MLSVVRKVIVSNSLPKRYAKERLISTTKCLKLFWEKDEKGGYRTPPVSMPLRDRMRLGLFEMKKEIKLWCDEMQEKFESDPIVTLREGETDVLWRFKNANSLDNWMVTSDSDHNEGFSYCSLQQNGQGNGVFSGYINLQVPKDGKIKRAGYCHMKTLQAKKSFKREVHLDWTGYNTLVMKVRGDGRTYLLTIATKGYYDIMWNDQYHYQLYTRGGPYWQVAKIPFSKFFFTSKGRIQDSQGPIPLYKVTSFGISAQDRHGGEFNLEIDYVGLEYDPKYTEEFAYEQYDSEGIAGP